MQIIKSTVFRALCAIAIGYMLVAYPEDMQQGFVRAIGALFFVSGAIAWASFLYQTRNVGKVEVFDAAGNKLTTSKPFFPIAGTGSIILGLVLIVMPDTLIDALNIVFGVMIMLGGFNQFVTLMKARHYSRVPMVYWLMASFILLVGMLIVAKPSIISETVAFFMQLCGWCFIAYAFLEVLIGVQTAIYKRQYDKANRMMFEQKAEEENAVLIRTDC